MILSGRSIEDSIIEQQKSLDKRLVDKKISNGY